MKRTLVLSGALIALSMAAPAVAQLSDSFDGEAGGTTQLNYTGFANFDVTAGTVDILRDPNGYNIGCVGGAGSCVDLDGSTGAAGTLTTKNSYAFNAGNVVTLSFDLSGNQRGAGPDDFFTGFTFVGSAVVNQYTVGGAFGTFNFGDFGNISAVTTSSSIGDSAPFGTYTISFTAGSAGSLFAFVGADGTDNQGPILDNFNLSIAAVPEPATWGLMILGFGAVGATLRRRSTKVAYAA